MTQFTWISALIDSFAFLFHRWKRCCERKYGSWMTRAIKVICLSSSSVRRMQHVAKFYWRKRSAYSLSFIISRCLRSKAGTNLNNHTVQVQVSVFFLLFVSFLLFAVFACYWSWKVVVLSCSRVNSSSDFLVRWKRPFLIESGKKKKNKWNQKSVQNSA